MYLLPVLNPKSYDGTEEAQELKAILNTYSGTVGNELGRREGTGLLDLDNPNWEHAVGLGGPFPVFLSLSFFSFFSLLSSFTLKANLWIGLAEFHVRVSFSL